MTTVTPAPEERLRAENAELRTRLEQAEETLRAIRSGEVDALIVETVDGPQIFTLQGVDAESNRFRGEILAQVSDSVVAVGADRRVTYLNAAAQRQYGVSAATALGCKLADFYELRWLRAEDESESMTALRDRGEWRGENIHVTRAGRELHVESSVTVIRAGDGSPRGLIAVIRDCTERKRAEADLRQREHFLQRVTDVTPGVIQVFDLEKRCCVFANRSVAGILGYTPEEIAALADNVMPTLMHPDDMARFPAHLERVRALRDDEIADFEHRMRGPAGEWQWFHSRDAVFARDAAGAVCMLIGTAIEITQRKRNEAELQSVNAELETRVAERTAKLQELVGELEHFSYTLTHDLRAPLRGMQGFSELMGEALTGGHEQEAQRFLRRIQTSASRMDLLITDALNYSRAVRQELPLAPVDAGALLRGMLDSYPEFQPSKAQIEIEGEIPLVMGNEAGLTQCFSNLLGNAVKFVQPGQQPQIRIWAERREDAEKRTRGDSESHLRPVPLPQRRGPSAWVRIWVEDKGVGIPGVFLPRVFEMFSRGHNAYEGTGIGLALVRKAVGQMGGKAGVESEEGRGSRFWLELGPGDRREGR